MIGSWLLEDNRHHLESLWKQADDIRRESTESAVHLRGLIEFSNECVRSCTYCGLRCQNRCLPRYRMTLPHIMACAEIAHAKGYGSVVLQSGEDQRVSAEWIGEIIRQIKDTYPLAVTLSVGERPVEDYRLWREKGADRYLLRFETSDDTLYRRLHPHDRSGLRRRIELLHVLRALGYEIGSGNIVGLPGQSFMSLAEDILIFSSLDLDMIGIGPYIPHPDTPLGREDIDFCQKDNRQVPNSDIMARKVLAITRLVCPEANIPVTTAFATANTNGYEIGLHTGANVIMPALTPPDYRKLYDIYPSPARKMEEGVHERIMTAIYAAGRKPGCGPGNRSRKSAVQ